jgi:hypothetical protein
MVPIAPCDLADDRAVSRREALDDRPPAPVCEVRAGRGRHSGTAPETGAERDDVRQPFYPMDVVFGPIHLAGPESPASTNSVSEAWPLRRDHCDGSRR